MSANTSEATFFEAAMAELLLHHGVQQESPEKPYDDDMASVLGTDGKALVSYLQNLQDRGIGFSLEPLRWSDDFSGVVIPMKFAGSDDSKTVTIYPEHAVVEAGLLSDGFGQTKQRVPTWQNELYGEIAQAAGEKFGPEKVARMMAVYGKYI